MIARPAHAALCMALAPACAAAQSEALLRAPRGLPDRAKVAGVRFIAETERDCAAAALGMALAWSGVEAPPATLSAQVYTPARQGALRSDVVAAARRHGRLAVPLVGLRAVIEELAQGHPVIVFQNLGLAALPRWHYALAVGYDLAEARIDLHSGELAWLATGLANFERTWARGDHWALVVLPPQRLPVSAGELDLARAAAALENAGQIAPALVAYEAILERYPHSFAALAGGANARYVLGDHAGAVRGFRAALVRDPAAAAVWNNLAMALAVLGEREDARTAARRAVDLAGPHEREACERTLAQLDDEK